MFRVRITVMALLAPLLPLVAGATSHIAANAADTAQPGHYRNPLRPRIPGHGTVDGCADPTVLRGRGEQRRWWYMFCTTDPLNDAETVDGTPEFHRLPMTRSRDLVSWRYVGDALPDLPSWAADEAALWAPDLAYSRAFDRYYLTFVVTDTTDAVSGEPGCAGDNAIGVATSDDPTGPWRVLDRPVVPPRRAGPGCNFWWTFDPDVLGDAVGRRSMLYYGSYYGGMFGDRVRVTRSGIVAAGSPRRLTRGAALPDPQRALRAYTAARAGAAAPAALRTVAIANRYEGANVVRRGGWYYLFASATNCCNGPLTGYSVFAGRSRDPLGPFRDREGVSFLAGRVGGTPVVSMNGNRWVGTGHSSAFLDRAGQWWLAYHAADRFDPYFASQPGFTKRPALLDPLTWRRGWPEVRAGRWASDARMPAPAAQPGQRSDYRARPMRRDRPGRLLPAYTDRFSGNALADRWSWVRQPAGSSYGVAGGSLRFDTQSADLSVDSNDASVLTEPSPAGDYMVQTKVQYDLPAEGCCHNFAQAGLVIYADDDAFVKLVHVSIFETRQTEWAKEVRAAPAGYPRYGNTVVGPPSGTTLLRVVRRAGRDGASESYTAYTRREGERWVRGGTWRHRLGDEARIGLVSMGLEQDSTETFTARFDNIKVWRLARPTRSPREPLARGG